MGCLRSIVRGTTRLNQLVGSLISWYALGLVIVTCMGVFSRYVLNRSSLAWQELTWHLFGALFLLGAAHTLAEDGHVRVDVFYQNFSKKWKAIVNLLGSLLGVIPICAIVGWHSVHNVMRSLTENSGDPGGLPARVIIKATIPIGLLLLVLQGAAMACQAIIDLRTPQSVVEEA
ncbi:MAG: TRAP-type mannitol/chloroaromatic compound transport system permease small subunit [Rhodothermales bacterium]